MRTLSSSVLTLLARTDIQAFYLVDLGASANPATFPAKKHCSLLRNVTFDGNVYHGAGTTVPGADPGRMISIEPPRATAAIDRQSYLIKYADPEFLYRPGFEDGYTGANVVVRLAFINTTDVQLGTTLVDPGQPLLDPADVIIAYEGKVDNQTYDINPNESVVATIECSAPLGQISLTKPAYTSRDWMNQIDSNFHNPATRDTSFDAIFEGSKSITLLWGKR